ncbi:endochitinase 2-like isoform X2 [Micropterus salmoides]|uniref:endochitinase 2-like isoform X2 n=1 Tax=Micropterus salmoides TaxID=27706 RepID=UPI0018EC9682|nr:endochitinase 2-like isoform X2 [Micropterus salmoides]
MNMKVHHTLICFFFLTLQDGNTGLINAEILVKEGGNITRTCFFTFSGGRKIFCKEECEEQDILVETAGDRAQSGRYSIEYKKGSFPVSDTLLYVSIKNLTKSDSGRYRCRLTRFLFPDSYEEFDIRVEDDPTTSKPNWTPRPLSTSVPSASTLTTTQSLSTSSKSSTPSSASPEATKQTHQEHRTPAAGPATGVPLYVGLILVAMIILLSAAVLIFCRKRTKEPPVESEYANVTKPNPMYEEIRDEDRQSRSSPVEISTVYTYAKYTKPNGVETTDDDYSFVTAASSQKTTEDNSNELNYSQVDFSKAAAASLNSSPCGKADNVLYSVPRVEASLDGRQAEDTSPPLYSTVS